MCLLAEKQVTGSPYGAASGHMAATRPVCPYEGGWPPDPPGSKKGDDVAIETNEYLDRVEADSAVDAAGHWLDAARHRARSRELAGENAMTAAYIEALHARDAALRAALAEDRAARAAKRRS